MIPMFRVFSNGTFLEATVEMAADMA